jgi:hypothetical protein
MFENGNAVLRRTERMAARSTCLRVLSISWNES